MLTCTINGKGDSATQDLGQSWQEHGEPLGWAASEQRNTRVAGGLISRIVAFETFSCFCWMDSDKGGVGMKVIWKGTPMSSL